MNASRSFAACDNVFAAAQLAALRRVDTPEPDADSMNFQCVAINDTGLTNKVISQHLAREEQELNTSVRRLIMVLDTR